ncbi:MAG: hypothetical protein LBJ64_09380 [Deltaproteobacteria bacterium]|jgi:hypothetical protein|nr:hypothetical protein [Deltaproteobacteria bacterium]
MAGYKVSFKILRQQGESMKAVAKTIDGFADQLTKISGKLGTDDLLAEVRNNLKKLNAQLTESQTKLGRAGDLLVKTVEKYIGTEKRQVKKSGGTKAHNRDFYKRPVAVASVAVTSTTTVNYVDQSTHIGSVSVSAAPDVAPAPSVEPAAVPQPAMAEPTPVAPASPAGAESPGSMAGGAIATGALGGIAAAMGGLKLKEHADAKKEAAEKAAAEVDESDPEAELQRAIQRVRDLENADEGDLPATDDLNSDPGDPGDSVGA